WLGGRPLAAPLVVALSFAGSLFPVLDFAFTTDRLYQFLSWEPWPQGWMFQASWAPQHLASASCIVVAVLLFYRIASSRNWRLVPLLAVVAAAGFESSVWVGGIVFPVAAVIIGSVLLLTTKNPKSRLDLMCKAGAALILAVVISLPFLQEEYAATTTRNRGFP